MKELFAKILVTLILLLTSCSSIKHLRGIYTNGADKIYLFVRPNKFKFYARSEMGLLGYSKGRWRIEENKLILTGYEDSLGMINPEIDIREAIKDTKDKIIIKYDRANPMIKLQLFLNEIPHTIYGDTIFFSKVKIKNIQIKSYLSYDGLLSVSPHIDTLYSKSVNIDYNNNIIFMDIKVRLADFVRVKLSDTLTIRNKHTLILNNGTKFKKLKDIIFNRQQWRQVWRRAKPSCE